MVVIPIGNCDTKRGCCKNFTAELAEHADGTITSSIFDLSGGEGANGDGIAQEVVGGLWSDTGDSVVCIADDSEDEDDPRTQWTLIWNQPEGEPPEGGYKLILILCPL